MATWRETATVCGADRWVEQVRQTPFDVCGTSGGDAGGGPAMRMCVSLILHQPRVHDVSILMTMAACYEMYEVLQVGGVTTLEWMVLVLFVLLFAWVAFSPSALDATSPKSQPSP